MKTIVLFLFIIFTSHAYAYAEDCPRWFKNHGILLKLKYAQFFKLYKHGQSYLLLVGGKNYFLTPNNKDIPCKRTGSFNIPVKRVIPLSTTHIPAITLLGEGKSIKGFSNIKYISSPLLNKREIREVRFPPHPELVLQVRPDLVMAFVVKSSKIEGIDSLLKLKLPVVFNLDFLEQGPLARAEWIRFMGVFYNKEKLSLALFNDIEKRFNDLKEKVEQKVKKRPMVLVGQNYQGIWRGPLKNSDFVSLLKSAGANYFLDQFKSVHVNREKIVKNLKAIDYWLPQNSWHNLNQLVATDKRFKSFPTVAHKRVYNSTLKVNRNGGNDYWETAFMRPDLLLRDLVKIFHPELVPNHQLYWFKRMKYE